jgi:hypothetical protein
MKGALRRFAFRSLLSISLIGSGLARAEEPPRPLPIAEKVARASLIFIGTPSRVAIEFKDPLYFVDMTVKIDEVLLPRRWRPGRKIHMRLALDLLNNQVVDLLVGFKNKQQLFLLMQPWYYPNGKRSSDFAGSGDYNQIAVPIAERARVEEELKKRGENRGDSQ